MRYQAHNGITFFTSPRPCSIGIFMRIVSVIICLLLSTEALCATPISAPGAYDAGDYELASNISISSGNALAFTGAATLDMKGHHVTTSATGNAWDVGIEGDDLTLKDTIGGSKISGFRVGAKIMGTAFVQGIDLSANRYMGLWIIGDNGIIESNHISSIGGVTDEPYAIGVQVGGTGNLVINNSFGEFYTDSD